MANKQQVVYVERKHGLVHFVVFTVLFGIWYWLFRLTRWCARTTVRLVTWPFRAGVLASWKVLVAWPWRACQAAWPHVVRGVQTFHTRYGWRGWGIVAAVVIVLGIIGNIVH